MWDTSWLLSDNSVLGKALQALVGYTAQPSLIQIVFYVVTLGCLYIFSAYTAPKKSTMAAAA
jgi:high-affinity iron transporter